VKWRCYDSSQSQAENSAALVRLFAQIDFPVCNEESLRLPLALLFGFLDGLAELLDSVDLRRIQ
jgi:hypothetical protein